MPLDTGQIPRGEGLAHSWQGCIPGILRCVVAGIETQCGLVIVFLVVGANAQSAGSNQNK